MNKTTITCLAFCLFATLSFLTGCSGTLTRASNDVQYIVPNVEAAWIRDGQPLVFENESWKPQDDIDVLTDNEVCLLGEYQGVQFFIEKADVRPYNRLYTKFAPNRFRVYKKVEHD